jgi:hypothetical protein
MKDPLNDWLLIGLILAGDLLFALAIAALTRIFARAKMHGQTFALVVAGVAGIVTLAGAQIGWANVGFLMACFGVAGIVMGIEYYSRLFAEHKAAQDVHEAQK